MPNQTTEVDSYLSVDPDSTIDPFLYWREEKRFPNLRKMALQLLAIPSTSSESERVFSVAGAVFSPKRMRLSLERLQDLTFCSINTKIYD
uniref:Dimer_Tnp_hAT domain-containing protein n=1 Tax=Caenorhabditis japonica TaxID=281687 RepID=A0A8R1HV27_CAEJA